MIVYALLLTFKGYTFHHSYSFATEEYCRRAGESMVKEGMDKYTCKREKV